ncbi:aspartate--tRNA ligase [Mycoplasma sp. P36-A1]|uniref:aspartate--tRNA ligase n=1 Tax=Mycoplasma sp. P36-A1 TaxID=3252900 RepID=UPI003C30C38D
MKRTHNNGQLRLEDLEQEVTLIGWVAKKRNLGSLVFIDLRDRYGITQIIFDEKLSDVTTAIRNEYIIEVKGNVSKRRDANPNLATGEIEVIANSVNIINTAKTTPIIIADETDALEDTRMKYRYLDLRRPIMQQKFIMRAKLSKVIRNYLDDLDFIDVETPILTASTPEGARDYVVPSRVHHDSFYALPQSPQLFKQLLMVAGFEKYYQIAKCFRDEDLRADRQPEFTQVDIETSFLSMEEIQTMIEGLFSKIMKEVQGVDIKIPFDRISYNDAMNKYGSDKPDLRYGFELQDLNETLDGIDFGVFSNAIKSNGNVKALVIKDNADKYSRKDIDKLEALAKKNHAKGLAWLKVEIDKFAGPIAKFFNDEYKEKLINRLDLEENDLVLFVADKWDVVCNSLGALRTHLANELNYIDTSLYAFCWVIDWPLYEYSEEDNRYYAAHHPFTRPAVENYNDFDTNQENAKAQAYDIVLNGYEIGGGSLRIYDQEMQKRMFKALGFTAEEIQSKFGFFVDALQYGTPPHGGIALGLDRLAMILSGGDSIRDVIAFPKNASAVDPMSEAPNQISDLQKEELGIVIKK